MPTPLQKKKQSCTNKIFTNILIQCLYSIKTSSSVKIILSKLFQCIFFTHIYLMRCISYMYINRRISISRNCMQMLDRHIWRSMISVSTKLRLYNVYILPVFLYGAETWSITKAIEKRIDAFDQWFLRRILNITWSECITNFEVRRRTGQPLLSDTVRIRRLKLFGHVARADKSQDYSRALQACISPAPRNWRRRPGHPTHTWLRTVEEDLRQFNLGLVSGLQRAQNRTAWRTLTGTAMSPTSSD